MTRMNDRLANATGNAGLTRLLPAFTMIVALMLMAVVLPTYGKQITVSKDGIGDYHSIQAAIDAASSGDTVYVEPGLYEEQISITKDIILQGSGAENTIIRYAGTNGTMTLRNISSGSVDGFTIEYNGTTDETCVINLFYSKITISNCLVTSPVTDNTVCGICASYDSDVTIESNVIRGNNGAGINLHNGAKGTIRNNVLCLNAHSGMEVKHGASAVVEKNYIRDNELNGIGVFDSAEATISANEIFGNGHRGISIGQDSDSTIDNNTIRDNKQSGIIIWGNGKATIKGNEIFLNSHSGIDIVDNPDTLVENNALALNEESGITADNKAQCSIKNNLLVLNGCCGISRHQESEVLSSHNDVWGNEYANYWGMSKSTTDISADPQFVDLENRNFHLRLTSPCIGAGEEGVDIGAYPLTDTQPLLASFTFHVVDEALHKIHLDASSSIDTMGTIIRYEWDWDGDGTYDTAVCDPR